MFQGIFQSYALKVCGFLSAERSAGCSDQQFMYLLSLFPVKCLENGTVFAVYRQNLYAELLCQRHDQVSGCDQSFLVCQCNILACKNGLHGRTDADHSHNGSHQNVGFFHSGKFDQSTHLADNFYIQITDSHFQISGCFFFPDCDQFRVKFTDLFFQKFYIASGCKTDHFQVIICPDYV